MDLTPTQLAYREYLKSEHWDKLKQEKRGTSRRPPGCEICGSRKNIQLHHLFYRARWEDTVASDLRWVCEVCHKTIHDLISKKNLVFPQPLDHYSVFKITKDAVAKQRKINQFQPKKAKVKKRPTPICAKEAKVNSKLSKNPPNTGSPELDRAILKCDWVRVRQIEEKKRRAELAALQGWPKFNSP